MLNVTVEEARNLFVVELEGKLGADDFNSLSSRIDDYINEKDRVPSLVIKARQFPHWKDFGSMMAHLKFVRDHQKVIPKVALVSDVSVLSIMPAFVDFFVGAKIRHFDADDVENATAWAAEVEPKGKAFREIDGMPPDVLAFEVVGKLTSKDYLDFMYPLVEEKLKTHDKLKCLIVLDEDFEGATASAMWDDARLGLNHYYSFPKMAIVSDIGWVRRAIKLMGPLFPGQIIVFDRKDLEAAKVWITS